MKKHLFNTFILVSAPTLAQAANEQNTLALPAMVVTATRNATSSNELAAATTVYTRQDIEQRQVKTLPELLKGTLGLDMAQQGGYGKITDFFMRGTNSDHILVLMDGIKIGSVSAGTTPFELLPIDQIERVEIIRGPASSLYGSEALGGVIQIFTRKSSTEQSTTPRLSLQAGGGSYDTARTAGTVSGQWQDTWYNLGVSHFNTQGINARKPIPGAFGFNQPDRDGYQNTGINARVGHHFANSLDLEAFFMHSQGDTQFDSGYGGDRSDFINQVVGAKASMALMDNWRSSINLGQSRDDNTTFCGPNTLERNNTPCYQHPNAFDSRFNSTRWNASWQNEIKLNSAHTLNLGTDYRLDEIASSTAFNQKSRYDVGVFGHVHSQWLEHHFVDASLRWDHNEAAGNYVTGNFGWRYEWDYGLSLLANFGNAFKAPTFNQLYYPNYGNPNLHAEESTSFETGIAGKHRWAQWELRAYHTNIDQLIITVTNPTTFNSTAENIGKAEINGLEAEIRSEWQDWHAQLNLNLMSPVNRISNARLPRRADRTLSFDLSRSFGALDVGVNVMAQGMRFDDPSNKKQVAGFVTTDLRTTYHINQNWSLSGQLNNLLDKNYQTVDTYNSFGRNFFLSIHYNN